MIYINKPCKVMHHRGDSLSLFFDLRDGDSITFDPYPIGPDDEFYFAILEPNQIWENAIVKKKIQSKDLKQLQVNIEPKDTMCLIPGLYYYQIKLRNNKDVYTLMNRTPFWINE